MMSQDRAASTSIMFSGALHASRAPVNPDSKKSGRDHGASATELDPNIDEGWLHRQGLGLRFYVPILMAIGGSKQA